MKLSLLIIPALSLWGCSNNKTLSAWQTKQRIDTSTHRGHPSSDLLPPEFNTASKENEYYFDYAKGKGHVSVLRLRENGAFIYETYYIPYKWARVNYRIGNYHLSGDSVIIQYRPLLKGKEGSIYIRPTIAVSWVPPPPPEYLLLQNNQLYDPVQQRTFQYLTEKPQFNLKQARPV